MLSQVNRQLRKQLIIYYSKVKMNDFKEILFSLLLRQSSNYFKKWLYEFSTIIYFQSKNFFCISKQTKDYTFMKPLFSEIDRVNKSHDLIVSIFVICKFNKTKLIKYILKKFRNNKFLKVIGYLHCITEHMNLHKIYNYIHSLIQINDICTFPIFEPKLITNK